MKLSNPKKESLETKRDFFNHHLPFTEDEIRIMREKSSNGHSLHSTNMKSN